MKKTSTLHYILEDENGGIEPFNQSDFNKMIEKEKVVGRAVVELIGEDEDTFLVAPILRGYGKPYDWDIVDDIGIEHYIYYEKETL